MRYFSFFLLFSCLFFVGCGKVVQDVSKTEESVFFDLKYQVSIVPTSSITSVYAQVFGLDAKAKRTELSWGRAAISFDSVVPTSGKTVTPVRVYRSVSYRKDGVKLAGASEHTWTKLSVGTKGHLWQGDSVKIRYGYSYYVVSVFVDPALYSLKILDAKTVSQNRLIQVDKISDYDTFLATLFLMFIKQDSEVIEKQDVMTQLARTFPKSFFDALVYVRPRNQAESFNSSSPIFEFSGSLETSLLTIFQMVQSDPKEAVRYTTDLKAVWLSKESKKQLLVALKRWISFPF
ncbi:MAG: hypothetical protein EXS67_01280 [Candidatus Margulisbacteria bacterium]|nr:hypothetical protein [Candidatus Margulisiibacteriota bacterium]